MNKSSSTKDEESLGLAMQIITGMVQARPIAKSNVVKL